MALQVVGDAMPRDRANARTDQLGDDQQRVAEHHDPREAEAELRANLAVGTDTAGIIIRRAGDQSGAKLFAQRARIGLVVPVDLVLDRLAHGRADPGSGTAGLSALIAAWTRASTSSRGRPAGMVLPIL